MTRGLHHRLALVSILSLICAVGATADEFAGLSPPVQRITMLVDTRSEDPPTYSGMARAPRPQAGAVLDLQVFAPDAAGMTAYAYIVQFDDTGSAFAAYFTVEAAGSWTARTLPDATGRPSEVLTRTDMGIPSAGTSPGVSGLFPDRPSVPASGLIATITLRAVRDVPPDVPLTLKLSVAVYSITSPTRLWHMIATRTVPWS